MSTGAALSPGSGRVFDFLDEQNDARGRRGRWRHAGAIHSADDGLSSPVDGIYQQLVAAFAAEAAGDVGHQPVDGKANIQTGEGPSSGFIRLKAPELLL